MQPISRSLGLTGIVVADLHVNPFARSTGKQEATVSRYILTGGPGAGKTTLLNALGLLGYATVEESARAIIAERRAAGATPRPLPVQFAREILRRDIEKYEMTRGLPDSAIFDRGVVEALGVIQENETWPRLELERVLAAYPFAHPVFILPPWPEIYTVDAERDQTFEEAVTVYEKVVNWYSHCGYQLHEVDLCPVDERAKYVHRMVSRSPSGMPANAGDPTLV